LVRHAVRWGLRLLPQSGTRTSVFYRGRRFLDGLTEAPERRYARWLCHFFGARKTELCTPEFLAAARGTDALEILLSAYRESDAPDVGDAIAIRIPQQHDATGVAPGDRHEDVAVLQHREVPHLRARVPNHLTKRIRRHQDAEARRDRQAGVVRGARGRLGGNGRRSEHNGQQRQNRQPRPSSRAPVLPSCATRRHAGCPLQKSSKAAERSRAMSGASRPSMSLRSSMCSNRPFLSSAIWGEDGG